MRDPSSPKDDHRAGGGSSNTPSAFEATYALEDEDHTLGNCLRSQEQKPRRRARRLLGPAPDGTESERASKTIAQ